jgi:glycosyltransferase involved in cell wall biosynthesis
MRAAYKKLSKELRYFTSVPLYDRQATITHALDFYPKISVVTISYNQVNFIERTILSVLNQQYPNLEYIIIDGGSTDGSDKVIKKYESYLTYWCSEKDKGPAHALNKGFQKATGEWFFYLNSDDILLTNSLFTFIGVLKSLTTSYDVIYGHGYIIDSDGNILKKSFSDTWNLLFYVNQEVAIFQPSTFIKKELFNKVNGFNELNKTCWDGEFLVNADLENAKFYRLSNSFFLSAFRFYATSISSNIQNNDKFLQLFLIDHNKIWQKVSLDKNIYYLNKYLIKVLKFISNPQMMCYRLYTKIYNFFIK